MALCHDQTRNLHQYQSIIQQWYDKLAKFNSFVIVDDLLATGGTVECVSKLLKDNEKEIKGLITVVELSYLKGKVKFDFPVKSMISF